jgi:multiple sugar transport system permease protein
MLGLASFKDDHVTYLNLLMAGSVIVIAPVFVLFLVMQRFFREGLQLTGMVA